MSMNRKVKYAGIFCLVALTMFSFNGCSLFKKSTVAGKTMSEDENVVRKAVNAQPEWKFVEIRMTGRADEDGKKIGFMGTIKLEKDKQIFVMMRSSIGIEVARIYANRDSVWITSKMLGIKEKGNWKLIAAKIGYPVDFYAVQGIFNQALFTSAGDQLKDLIENLVIKGDKDNLRLVTMSRLPEEENGIKYSNEFVLDKETFLIQDSKMRDIKGQWIADVKYLYNKENVIKKIELKGIDSERNFAVDVNIVKKEIKETLDFNFDRF